MQRYNPFSMMHKALRAMLYDAALTLQQTYFANESEAEAALEKVEAVLYLFEKHAGHEDNSILSAIEYFEHELVREFEQEHAMGLELGNRLKHLLLIFRNTDAVGGKIFVGSAISKSFVEFMIFNLGHMAKEEIVVNKALWKHYTDEQLALINQKMRAAMPAQEKVLSARWILRSINDAEAINWLNDIRETAPRFVFEALLSLTETELPEDRRERVLNGVLESSLVAYS